MKIICVKLIENIKYKLYKLLEVEPAHKKWS